MGFLALCRFPVKFNHTIQTTKASTPQIAAITIHEVAVIFKLTVDDWQNVSAD